MQVDRILKCWIENLSKIESNGAKLDGISIYKTEGDMKRENKFQNKLSKTELVSIYFTRQDKEIFVEIDH